MEQSTKTYIITESIDEGVMRMWVFQATDKMALAKEIVENDWTYYDMLERIGFRVGHRRYERPSPEFFLKILDKSDVDGDSSSGFQLFEIKDLADYKSPTDVTWTRFDREIWS